MFVCYIPTYTPLVYSKTGVYMGFHNFIFFSKTYMRRFLRVPTIYVLSKTKKNVRIFNLKITIFTAMKYCCIWYWVVFVISTLPDGNIANFTEITIICTLNSPREHCN